MVSDSLRRAALCAVILLSLHCTAPNGEAQSHAIREALTTRVEALRKTGRLEVRGSRLASVIVLPDFYQRREFRLAWESRTIDQLLRAIRDAEAVALAEGYLRGGTS